jgi:ribosomal protein L16/L10AE
MLMPKKVKYRKRHKGRMGGTAFRGGNLDFVTFAIFDFFRHQHDANPPILQFLNCLDTLA